MGKKRDVKEWLRRAKSNLAKSKTPKTENILYEDFCFDCQQCAEKALKGLIITYGIDPS